MTDSDNPAPDLSETEFDYHLDDEPRNIIKKGADVDLMELDPGLKTCLVGMGWDLKAFEGEPPDLDASVFLLDKDDMTRVNEDFIFYNNPKDADGAVHHKGDSRTGAGDGDDEIITIDLTHLSFEVLKIVFVISIHEAQYKNHDFSMVKNVYLRFANAERDDEMFRYELDDNLGNQAGLVVGALERIGTQWIFKALSDPIEGGLAKIAGQYGIIVAEEVQG